jgi:hypothetical protein
VIRKAGKSSGFIMLEVFSEDPIIITLHRRHKLARL